MAFESLKHIRHSNICKLININQLINVNLLIIKIMLINGLSIKNPVINVITLINHASRPDKDLLAAPAVKTPDVCLWCAFGTLGQGALCLCMSTSGGRELNRSYSPLHCTWNMLSLVFCILPSLVRTTVELSCGGDVWCFPVVSTHQNKTKTLTGPCIRTTSSI